MKVNDVIKQVAIYLGLSNIIEANLDNIENLDLQTKKDVNLLLSSINQVLCDVSTDYLPLEKDEDIEVADDAFDLTTLSKAFYKLTKVYSNKKYLVDFETLKIETGNYKIRYQYLPDILELGDEIDGFERLTIYALSYGVAEEYCLISGNYSESEMWHSKFEYAMKVAKRSVDSKVVTIKNRRWL